MKSKLSTIDTFRWCGFAILALVSLFFIYNLSISLAVEKIEKFVIVSGALGLEFFKLFSIIAATTYGYIGKQLGIKIRKRAFLYFTYVWVSLYSVLASFGYATTTVDRMQATVTILNHTELIANEKESISNVDATIKEYKNTKVSYENSKVAYINEINGADATDRDAIQKKINALQINLDTIQKKIDIQMDKKSVSQSKIEDWKSKDLSSNQITKRTMYDVISDTVKLPPKTIAFIVLLIFSISIELGIFTLAPHTNKIDNMVVGDEETISNTKKKRKVFKKEEEVIPIEPIIEQPIKQEIKPIVKPEVIQEVQKILPMKIEHRAEEILQSLDEDKPAVSNKVKRMIVQM